MPKATLSPSLAREALSAHPADHRAKTAGSHAATRRTGRRQSAQEETRAALRQARRVRGSQALPAALLPAFFFQTAHTVGPRMVPFCYDVEMPKELNSVCVP